MGFPHIKTCSEIHFELVGYIRTSNLRSCRKTFEEIKWRMLVFVDHPFSWTDCQASDSPFFCPSSPASLSSDGLLLRTKNCPSAADGLGRLEAAIKRLCSSRSCRLSKGVLKIKIYLKNGLNTKYWWDNLPSALVYYNYKNKTFVWWSLFFLYFFFHCLT